MAATKAPKWKLSIFYLDRHGNKCGMLVLNLTKATARARANAACTEGLWTAPGASGEIRRIPVHRVRGAVLSTMEEEPTDDDARVE